MRDIIKSVIEFLLMFLLLIGVGAFIEVSSIALKINSTFMNIFLYSVTFILLGFFLFRVVKRHQLNKWILLIAAAVFLFLSTIIPDQSPTLLHTTKYTYTFGVPFPFITIYSENNSGFLLQHLSINNSYSVNIFAFIANIILMYFVIKWIRNIYHKPQIPTTTSQMNS
ncbi:hypothetical protein [Gracilibacillus saliphilus]|uniref:hypothetical protein n=1 Tax=Gracilibacillus saliphilus TaxID=543890 RepID=UPI0013D69076|nr:hypothetical protein [Gracilibacillus saliphilus]